MITARESEEYPIYEIYVADVTFSHSTEPSASLVLVYFCTRKRDALFPHGPPHTPASKILVLLCHQHFIG